jgi:hypothetical protein
VNPDLIPNRKTARRVAAPGEWLLLVALILTAALHALGFSGFWIGDDFGNIHQLYAWAEEGSVWAGLAEKMTAGNTPAGAFYRPALQFVRGVTWLIVGPDYTGWFAVSWLLHLLNTALVMALILRLAGRSRQSIVAAALAGLFFGASPVASEGVYWVASGGDAWVTLVTLLALLCWFGRAPLVVPLLFLSALGFKESAAVLPLQLLLLLMVPWHDGRRVQRLWAAGICLALLVGYFLLRAGLFGDAWRVYTEGQTAGLIQALTTVPGWWNGLTQGMVGPGFAFLAMIGLTTVLAAKVAVQQESARLFLALGLATGGLVLATLLNLGGLLPNGEGGRLFLTPMAWLALAAGSALAKGHKGLAPPARALLGMTAALGAVLLFLQYGSLRETQQATRQLVPQIASWVLDHPGTTLLLLPERNGRVPVLRNAQSGLVMPPLQAGPLLHRLLPTVAQELPARHAQIAGGLLTQIDALRPSQLDWRTITALLEPAPARWPDHYACWSWEQPQITPLDAPSVTDSDHAWLDSLAAQASAACRIDRSELR